MTRTAGLALLCVSSAIAADWNPRLAADYLDARQKEWFAWAAAKSPGGPCVSCHTGATYMMARPALRKVLGEAQPTVYETGLLDGMRARVNQREAKDVSPLFQKEPAASQAVGVEALKSGVKPGDARMRRAIDWLAAHQDRVTGAWAGESMNKKYPPESMMVKFMSDAATAYAALALIEGGRR